MDRLEFKNKFYVNILTLITGTTIAQAIHIILSPLLTRIYKPEDFGIYSVFNSIVAVISLFSTGKYEMAIMLPKNNKQSFDLVRLSLILSAVTCIFIFFVFFIFNKSIFTILNTKQLSNYWFLIPTAVFLFSVYVIYTNFFTREQKFKIVSLNKIFQSLILGITQVLFGKFSFRFLGLIYGFIISYLIGIFLFIRHINTKISFSFYNVKRSIVVAKEYIRLPKYELLHSSIDILHNYGVIFLIAYFYSTKEVGYFALATRILSLPISIIGSSISQVFYSYASKNKQFLKEITLNVLEKLILISIIPFPLLYVFANRLLPFVFGKEWIDLDKVVKALCFWLAIRLISSPLSTIPLIVNKQRNWLYIGILYNILIFGMIFLLGISKVDFYHSILYTFLTAGIFLVYVVYWLVKQTEVKQ